MNKIWSCVCYQAGGLERKTETPAQSLESSTRDDDGLNSRKMHIQITQEIKEKADKGNA